MPASAKRAQRNRRDRRGDATAADMESSPLTLPVKRRKKNDATSTPAQIMPSTSKTNPRRQQHYESADPQESSIPANVPEGDGRDLATENPETGANEGDQLVSRVAQHLTLPGDQLIQASKDHANSIHEASSDGVQAYAKIAAQDWTYYITKLEVNIGRASDPTSTAATTTLGIKDDEVHIDLGPSKTISRQHAVIYFGSKDEQWSLRIKGRNAAKVDGEIAKTGSIRVLRSGQVIEIGGVEMMFVLPTEISPLHIHETYLRRAGIPGSDAIPRPPLGPHTKTQAQTLAASNPESSLAGGTSRGCSSASTGRIHGHQQAIAPAPPDYRRPGTPPSTLRRRTTIVQTLSPYPATTPTPFGAPLEIDLSRDENHHIKPQYSYAQMITQAIMQTGDEKLNLNGIYNFILKNYSYYRHQEVAGWQNSIRHNLSLNKAFEKVARLTDEPGKGMKWQIVAEHRDEMIRNAYKGGRGGHRGSSAPSSPSQLNYITHGPRDMVPKEPATRKRKTSPRATSPAPASSLAVVQSTPDYNRSQLGKAPTDLPSDGSPLPRSRRPVPNGAPSSRSRPQSPTLASSFLHDDNAAFVTPAPPRINPRLAPPSTAPRPSQHMPTSSPAPFWKYADIGSTPLKTPVQFDASPSRKPGPATGQPSSSPPPRPAESPPSLSPRDTKHDDRQPARCITTTSTHVDEDQGFDLAKGFQSIGSYHAPVSHGASICNDGES